MASDNICSNSDLTTDATPSPQREKATNNRIKTERNLKNSNIEEEINANTNPKQRGFTKLKKTTQAPAFAASVYNINNSSGIHIGPNYTVVMNPSDKASFTKSENIVETAAINALKKSNEPLLQKHLLFISGHINEKWRDVARNLNYSEGRIAQFHEDHSHRGIKEVIYQFLLDWTQNEPGEATVGKLASLLWETNQKDAVSRWSLQ